MTSSNAISCTDVSVNFDGFRALNQVSLDVSSGQVVALIGPNGAGKTTLLNALSGRLPQMTGRVALSGRDVTRVPVHRRASLGLGRSFQIINIFPEMTVRENLRLAAQPHRFRFQPFWRDVDGWADLDEKARLVAEDVGLTDVIDRPAATLSHGRQRAVELGLALMSNPSVLMLDEPLAGVGQAEIEQTVDLIKRARKGRSVLLVEHNMDVVMSISDEIVVMMNGEILMRGTSKDVQSDRRVREAYLGSVDNDA